MRILLVKPPPNRHRISLNLYEPLDLEYLAAAVPGQEVKILDMRIEKNLQGLLERFRPHLVGVTAYTCDLKTANSILEEVKRRDHRIRTAAGGIHATFRPQDFSPAADEIFIGYADKTFRQYVEALEDGGDIGGIPNLCRRARRAPEELIFTRSDSETVDLEKLPPPARHLTRRYQKRYRDYLHHRTALVMSSRGCPFRCTFCACWKLMHGKYAVRSPEAIVREIDALPDEVELVYFSDDNTIHRTGNAQRMAELLIRGRNNRRFHIYARSDDIVRHPDLFAALKQAGLANVTVGLEAIRDADLVRINKRTTVALNDEAIRILKGLGIYINAHFIIYPDFDRESFRALYNYLNERRLFHPAFPVLTPLPGTELYAETRDSFVLEDTDLFDFVHSILPTRLPRREFYRRLAGLYEKSYSLRRYFAYAGRPPAAAADRTSAIPGTAPESNPGASAGSCNADGITPLTLILLRLSAIIMYLKIRLAYRVERSGRSARV
jgi:radical SAM superfamily enzyme YgiQ (UPF0313 family)